MVLSKFSDLEVRPLAVSTGRGPLRLTRDPCRGQVGSFLYDTLFELAPNVQVPSLFPPVQCLQAG